MIGYLSGRLMHRQPPFLLLDVGGVGYELEAPMTTFYDLPDDDRPVSLFVHLLVREDAQLLFGFSERAQRELFRNLLRVHGVGPRVALAILSTLSADQLIACVHREDVPTLTRVPGIGAKTAERMIFNLRDRLDAIGQASGEGGPSQADAANATQDAIGALLALGYKMADATRAVRAVEAQAEGQGVRREKLIRNALQHLSKR